MSERFIMSEIKFDEALNNCKSSIELFKNTVKMEDIESVKRGVKYFNWTERKSKKVITEKDDIEIPIDYLPQKITTIEYKNNAEPETKIIIDKYYKQKFNKRDNKNEYVKDSELIKNISNFESNKIANDLIFRRKNVVWVNFGFNIGTEFGGDHPAIILKKSGSNLIVLPLSTSEKSIDYENPKPHQVIVPHVYGNFEKIKRWTSVHRLKTISLKRIELSNYGNVHKDVMEKINESISKEFTKC